MATGGCVACFTCSKKEVKEEISASLLTGREQGKKQVAGRSKKKKATITKGGIWFVNLHNNTVIYTV